MNSMIKYCCFFVHTDLNNNLPKMARELERSILSRSLTHITVIGLRDTICRVPPIGGVRYISFSKEYLLEFINCNLMVSQENSDTPFDYIVMVDANLRVRGYYDGSKFDEYDRLATELDILIFEN